MSLTRLIYPFGLKALPPAVFGNGLSRSGVKSPLRGPVNPKKMWRATITMIRFTKLIRDFGLILGGGCNITGNGPSLMWVPSRIYGSPRINIKRFCNIAVTFLSQRSKVIHGVVLGTMGNPNRRKSQGFGGLVIECNFLYIRRGPGIQYLHTERSINFHRRAPQSDGVDIANDRITKVIHDIASIKNITRAYESIKSKSGNMTPGAGSETLLGFSLTRVAKISNDLKAGKFSFSKDKRVNISKSGSSKLRSFGIINLKDKIILTAMLQVLEPFYEKKFLDNSHGLRPDKGCHTALNFIKLRFGNSNWVVKGNIPRCFDDIDHSILLGILKRDIKCEKTVALLKKSLKNPFVGQRIRIKSKKGIFQESPLSSLLCNIYLHEMDLFIKSLIDDYDSEFCRRKSSQYRKTQYEPSNVSLHAVEKKQLIKGHRIISSKNLLSSDFNRVFYARYAAGFIIGTVGSKKHCEDICNKVKGFLIKTLALELNMNETTISNFNREGIIFLGTRIKGGKEREKAIQEISRKGKVSKVRTPPRVRLEVPIEMLLKKGIVNGFFKRLSNGQVVPTSLKKVVNLDHSDILRFFNQKIKGFLSYYSFVNNAKSLGVIVHGMKHSCALTLGLKFKLRERAKVFKKFGKYLECKKSGIKLFIPNSFSRAKKFNINPDFVGSYKREGE
jgi:retron-type reverse transcriptase